VFQTLDRVPSGRADEHGWAPYSRDGNLEALRLCEEVGLRCLVVDARVYRSGRPLAPELGDIEGAAGDYGAHPAFEGFLLYDEPSPHMYPILARAIERARPHLALVPMFPMHEDPRFPDGFEGRSYEQYLREHVAVCRPSVLAYDYYPFFDPPARLREWILNFEIARRVSDLPLWYYAGVCDPGPPAAAPTPGRIRLQVNMAIADGARAILHYTYAFVDAPTRAALAEVNRETVDLLRATVGLRCEAVWHSEPLPLGGSPPPAGWHVDESVSIGLLGGRLLVVNRDPDHDRTVRVGDRAIDLPAGGAKLTV
jgi:hypothetical protein